MEIEMSGISAFNISTSYQCPTRPPFVAVATLYGSLIAGTGGIFAANNAALIPRWTDKPAIEILVTNELQSHDYQTLSIAQAINQIRDGFGLKMSEVAQIFGVSRQASYLWLEGSMPKIEIANRIWKLSDIAKQLREAGLQRPEHFVHRPLSYNGKSLFQLLVKGEPVEQAVSVIKRMVLNEADLKKVQRVGAPDGDFSSVQELATPILEEHNS
jgi:DNA-binding XRE family transcriptional regulator